MINLKVDSDKCDGCGRCLVACTLGRALVGSNNRRAPLSHLLWIENSNNNQQIDLCRHCETPICKDACVASAIKTDSRSGTVVIHNDKCIGCWSCVMECPFRALRLKEAHAFKCDGCNELTSPLCAKFCPTGALQFSADNRGTALRRRRERALNLGNNGILRQNGKKR